ncbi:uncharacterized protein [Lepidochelys kempii]|uniref:uncharacterized protein n=1 Tax=Lepidochelys kempii TaxID=8472 RepID=UPI003C700422
MEGGGSAIVTCTGCAMFVFLPQDRSDFVCTKCKLVSILEEKIEGLEQQITTLRCIRETEDFLDKTQDMLLGAQSSKDIEQVAQRSQEASEEAWQHVTSRRGESSSDNKINGLAAVYILQSSCLFSLMINGEAKGSHKSGYAPLPSSAGMLFWASASAGRELQVTMQSSSAEVTMVESQNRKRAPAWTEREVRDLITVCGEESVLSELHSSFRNAKTFVEISQGMKDRGHNRDPKQCRVKLKELRQAYQKTREANGRSGSEPQTCRFYDELHAILGDSATTTPTVLFDSFNGDGGNTEAGFEDKEASSQQASGETGFPDSQELFLTLDLESPKAASHPPKAASRTHQAEKGPLLHVFHRIFSFPEASED